MKASKNLGIRYAVIAAIVCLMVACLALVACGGSTSSSAASSSASASASSESASAQSASTASSEASASSSAASTNDGFVGTWKIAAAEMQGITMGGNFGQLMGGTDEGTLTINADGTGKMAMGESSGDFVWAAEGADTIYITVQGAEASTQQAIPLTLKDGALFMPFEQNGQQATFIFTPDGTYANAKQISLTDAKPITSEAELLGTWKLNGLNMAGISMYGDPTALQAMMGGEESTITFKEGGVAEMSTGNGTWEITADGATLTSKDITGTQTVPVVKLGDDIALDYTEAYQGMEFIFVMAKA